MNGKGAYQAQRGQDRPRGQFKSQDRPEPPTIPQQDLEKIIVDGDAEVLVKWAEELGRALAGSLTTSQIRNFFGEVRKIDMNWTEQPEKARAAQRRFRLLEPKLAYAVGRSKAVEPLKKNLSPAIRLVQGDRERFRYFVDFFEAILAYHRKYGGKD